MFYVFVIITFLTHSQTRKLATVGQTTAFRHCLSSQPSSVLSLYITPHAQHVRVLSTVRECDCGLWTGYKHYYMSPLVLVLTLCSQLHALTPTVRAQRGISLEVERRQKNKRGTGFQSKRNNSPPQARSTFAPYITTAGAEFSCLTCKTVDTFLWQKTRLHFFENVENKQTSRQHLRRQLGILGYRFSYPQGDENSWLIAIICDTIYWHQEILFSRHTQNLFL